MAKLKKGVLVRSAAIPENRFIVLSLDFGQMLVKYETDDDDVGAFYTTTNGWQLFAKPVING